MDSGSEKSSSMSTTADHACDLCGCLRESPQLEPYLNNELQDVHLAVQAIHRLSNSLDHLPVSLMREFGNITTGQDKLRKELAEAERERDALRRRLQFTQKAYEAKSVLYDTTRDLFEKVITGFEPDREDRASIRFTSRLSSIKE